MKRTTTGILLIFLFLETVGDFFQLDQFVRDTDRWNFLPMANCRDFVYDKKCKAKSCFIGPFLQLLVGHNSISSASPPPKKMLPLEKNPFFLFKWVSTKGCLDPPLIPSKETCPLIVLWSKHICKNSCSFSNSFRSYFVLLTDIIDLSTLRLSLSVLINSNDYMCS